MKTDIAVIGGGPVGSATAILLARAGYHVTVFDANTIPQPQVGEVLPPTIRLPLEALGLWSHFCADAHLPSQRVISCWGSDQPYEADFLFNAYGSGWHINRERFNSMFEETAQASHVSISKGLRLVQADKETLWELTFEDAQNDRSCITADFVVDATGRARAFATLIGVGAHVYDDLAGMAVYYSREKAAPIELLIEADFNGWWYCAALPQERQIVVRMTDRNLMIHHSLEEMTPLPLIGTRTEGCEAISEPVIVRADSSCLVATGGERWLAVGDATVAFDPLAGQGLDRGLRSAFRAAEAISAALHGNGGLLVAYQTMQQRSLADYLRKRTDYYQRERRWPLSPFWQRRLESNHYFLRGAS